MDSQFSTAYFPTGTVPGISLNLWQNALYVYFLGMHYFDESRIYKINAETGLEIQHIQVGDGGYSPGGGMNASLRGEIYFTRIYEQRDGFWISAYGMVRDTDLLKPSPNQSVDNQNFIETQASPNYFLLQNQPNPFNPATTISYSLAKDMQVTLTIFNTLGQKVAELVNGFQVQGLHSLKWDAHHQPCGLYIYQLEAEGFVAAKKMLLQK